MTTKLINIAVPVNWNAPENMNTLKPEENAFILNMGCETIKDARALVAGLSEVEIYDKIREESKDEIKRLEIDLLVQKENKSQMEVIVKDFYENQLNNMKKENEELKQKLKEYIYQNKDLIEVEVKKEREKYKILLEEKEKQVNKINETHEYILKQNQKSNSHKGKEGEEWFEYYADETFRDFKGYNLMDKHTQAGAGDFHMQFEEFDVLVDAKNYKKKVPIDQREKIKKDLIRNEHLTFAWLVSLHTSIDKYDKAPVMYEWINTKQCIVYINNLAEYEDPRKILRVVWFTCKELYRFVEEIIVDNEELQELKDDRFKMMDRVRNFRKKIREINTTLNLTRNMLQSLDDEFKEILSSETENLVESNYSLFDEWWDTNIVMTGNDDDKLLSTDLWFKFRSDNKKTMQDFDVTTEKFRQFLKAKVSISNIILKGKHATSAFEIKCIKWKCIETNVEEDKMQVVLVDKEINKPKKKKQIKAKETDENSEQDKIEAVLVDKEVDKCKKKKKIKEKETNINFEEEKIQVILVDEVDKSKKKKRIKNKEIKEYFDEVKDKLIIDDYTESKDDIMDIAERHNVKTFEVISLLVRYKIISKRSQAKGYDNYKETEEYKNKINISNSEDDYDYDLSV
jgi:hypothetical protein